MGKIYKIHTYLSLIFLIPFIIISITGSILVYKHEINALIEPDKFNITVEQGASISRKPFEQLKQLINMRYPNYEIVGWNIDKNPLKTDIVWLIKHNGNEWESIQVDAINAKITSELLAHDEGLMGVLEHIHGEFLLEKPGKIFVGILGIIACFISLTGFLIYRNFFKNLFLLRLKRLIVFMSDIHKFIGVFSTPIMLIVALTGAWWNLSFLLHPSFGKNSFIIDDKIYNKNISIDKLIENSKIDFPGFNTHFIRFPFFKNAQIVLFGYKDDQSFLHNEYSSQVTYNSENGELVEIKNIKEIEFKEQFFSTFRKAHFGSYNQLTKFLWFVIGLTPLFLGVSGVYLWIKRKNFKRR